MTTSSGTDGLADTSRRARLGLAMGPMILLLAGSALADSITASTSPLMPRWLPVAALSFIALLAGVFALLLFLRQQIRLRTQALERRNEQLAIVNRTQHMTGSSLDPEQVLTQTAIGALDLSDFEHAVIGTLNQASGEIEFRVEVTVNRDNKHTTRVLTPRVTCPESLGAMIKDGRYHLSRQPPNLPEAFPTIRNSTGEDAPWFITFPLQAGTRIIGILCLTSRRSLEPSQKKLQLISELCRPVALAIENTRLYRQARRQGQELEARVEQRTLELSRNTEFWQALIDQIPSPIFYKNTDLVFLGCNQAYEQAFGVRRADIVSKRVLDLEFLPPADRQRFQREQEEMLTSGGTLRREVEIPYADGKIHHLLYSSAAFRLDDGKIGGIAGILFDISAQKEVEVELAVARDAAMAADRVKSAFLATMSHELRTPLNSVIGFTGILLQELAGPLNAEQRKQLEMVRNSARHLLALINDVLDISKIESGELNLSVARFDLADSIDKVIGIARPLAEAKSLELTTRISGDLPEFNGDIRRFEQILLNLISNAIKFTQRGSITVVANAELSKSDDEGDFVISVTDTGIGIRPEDIDELFMPFRQIDSRLSREHEGTGLGLAICQRLVSLMGGTIEVESEWQRGSTFSVRLPVTVELQEATP